MNISVSQVPGFVCYENVNGTNLLCNIFLEQERTGGDKKTYSPDTLIIIAFMWNKAISLLFFTQKCSFESTFFFCSC